MENARSTAIESFSISDDGKQSATLNFKKPMGFVKKTRTQMASNAVSHGVGIAGTSFGGQAASNAASPPGKKQKKQKSLSSAIMTHVQQP